MTPTHVADGTKPKNHLVYVRANDSYRWPSRAKETAQRNQPGGGT
jgi:hypothetical protein